MAYNRTFALDISWKSPHPRTCYAVGKYAGMLIRMRVCSIALFLTRCYDPIAEVEKSSASVGAVT